MKPDQLIKRRGKLGLIKAGADADGIKDWISKRIGIDFKVRLQTGWAVGWWIHLTASNLTQLAIRRIQKDYSCCPL